MGSKRPMNSADLIEHLGLQLESCWHVQPELEGGADACLDDALPSVKDEIQTLHREPQETVSLRQMMNQDKTCLHSVASLSHSGDDTSPHLLSRVQASELLACSVQHVRRLLSATERVDGWGYQSGRSFAG